MSEQKGTKSNVRAPRARKVVTTRTEIDQPDAAEIDTDRDEELENEESPEMSAVASLFGEVGSTEGVKVNVYRMPQVGQKGQQFCFSLDPSIDTMDMGDVMSRIQSDYGAGRYLLVARNRLGIVGKELIEVAASRRPQSQQPVSVALPAGQPVVEAITAAMRPLSDAVAALIAKQQAAPDPFDQLKKTMELVRLMSPAPVPTTGIDPMSQLTMLERLAGIVGVAGGAAPAQPKSMLSELMELWNSVGKPLVDQMIAQRSGQIPIPLQGTVSAAIPGGTQAVAAPTAIPAASRDPLQIFVASLVEKAKAGGQPEAAAAELIAELDKAPDQVYQTIGEFVERDDAITQLVQFAPMLSDRRGWLDAARNEFLRLTEPPQVEELETPNKQEE